MILEILEICGRTYGKKLEVLGLVSIKLFILPHFPQISNIHNSSHQFNWSVSVCPFAGEFGHFCFKFAFGKFAYQEGHKYLQKQQCKFSQMDNKL